MPFPFHFGETFAIRAEARSHFHGAQSRRDAPLLNFPFQVRAGSLPAQFAPDELPDDVSKRQLSVRAQALSSCEVQSVWCVTCTLGV